MNLQQGGTTAVDVKVKDDVAYVVHPSNLHAFDISDITNPQLLYYLEGGGGLAIEIEGNYAYCTSYSRLSVIDISNAADLKIAGYYPLPIVGSDVFVKNKIVHAACQNDGIYFIQFDEPTFIKEVNNNLNDFSLAQNYPNPFNPTTKIKYGIPNSGPVTLQVYNLLGEVVTTLVNEQQPAGNYEVSFDAANLSSGIYLYKIQAGEYTDVKKMILLR